jgi:hypothetical protein
MSKTKRSNKKIKSLIEAIKKINDDPNALSINEVSEKYVEDFSDKIFQGKKKDQLKSKKNSKKENKKDIFKELIELTEQFLDNDKKSNESASQTVKSGSTVNPVKNKNKKRLKQHADNALDFTLDNMKEILIKNLSEALFLGDGICGTESIFAVDSLNIQPQEFDFLDMLTVEPSTSYGQIIYEPESPDKNKEKVNRELYTLFSGGSYTFTSNNSNDLFTTTWSSANQYYTITGLTQGGGVVNVKEFITDYYDSIELPDLKEITKTAMLLTIQGGINSGGSIKFGDSLNKLLRLTDKLFSICGTPNKKDELKNQNPVDMFDETEEDIEFYFDFDDVEGIDLDGEDARFRRVLRFKDCYNFEIPADDTHIEDFIYLSNNKGRANAVDEALNKVATDAFEQSGGSISIPDFLSNLLSDFILNLPKALVMSIFTAKMFLPLVMLYKIFKQVSTTIVENIKEIIKKLYRGITKTIKELYWMFIRKFWEFIKIDLKNFISKLVQKIIKTKYKRYLLIITSLIALLKKISAQEIDNCSDLFQTILNTIKGAMSMDVPINVPSILLVLADTLPGYSQDRAYLNIMERLEASGVPTGPLYGESNDLGGIVKSIIDGHTEEEDANSFVKIVLKGGVLPGPTGGAVIPPAVISGVGKKF